MTSVDEDNLVDKYVDLLGCAIFCLVTICRRTEPAGDEERAYGNQEERRRGRRRFDVCSLLRNHPDSWTEGGGLGCVGDHCVHVFARGLNANIIIPPNRSQSFSSVGPPSIDALTFPSVLSFSAR